MTKIVIAGVSTYGLHNVSDDAMLSVFCRELHKNIADLKITLLARHPRKEFDKLYNINSIKNLDHDSKKESLGRWFNGLNPGDSTRHLCEIRKAIEACDLLIIGGEPFIDISIGLYRGLTPYASLLITLAKFLDTPVMIPGIHLGRPLKTDFAKEMAKFCMSNAKLVTIRDEESRRLFNEIGVKTDNVITLSDTAYGLERIESKELGQKILDKEGIKFISNKVIGVTFRYMYWKWREVEREKYSSIVANLCDFMIASFDVDIVFIPHCTYCIDHKYEDDRPASLEIIEKMRRKKNAHRITSRYNVHETLSLFPFLDMIFSNRRHSLIFGAIHDVVGMGVGEEWHMKPVLDQLGIGGDKFVDIESLGSEITKDNILNIWNSKDIILKKIKNNLPALRNKALLHAKLAADIIK